VLPPNIAGLERWVLNIEGPFLDCMLLLLSLS